MDWMKFFENSGVPMIILGFLLWYLIKPLFDSMIKNVNTQTEALQEILANCKDTKADIHELRQDVGEIKNNLKIKS